MATPLGISRETLVRRETNALLYIHCSQWAIV